MGHVDVDAQLRNWVVFKGNIANGCVERGAKKAPTSHTHTHTHAANHLARIGKQSRAAPFGAHTRRR